MTDPDLADLRAIVEDACTAPSLHNTQPWRWTARPDRLELRADWSRHLPVTDPSGRDLLVSCGAALHIATVSAAGRGWATTVRRFPDGSDQDLLATIVFSPVAPTRAQQDIASAVGRRRSDRRPVSSWPVPEEWVDSLRQVAASHGVLATAALDDGQAHLMEALLRAARQVQSAHEGYVDELEAWTRASEPDEGVPAANLLDSSSRFPAGTLAEDHHEPADPAPTWLLLCTSSDDPLSWLRTGEALAAQWLACTVGGLSLLPFSQPIDVAVTHRVLQDAVLADAAVPQLVVRLGWPPISRVPVPAPGRRPVDEVLTVEHPSATDRRGGRSTTAAAAAPSHPRPTSATVSS